MTVVIEVQVRFNLFQQLCSVPVDPDVLKHISDIYSVNWPYMYFLVSFTHTVSSCQVIDQSSELHIDFSNCAFSSLAAQIKSMVNQLGTRQDTGDLRERLWVRLFYFWLCVSYPVLLYSKYVWFVYSQQVQHYTNQLAKETNKHLKDLGSLPVSLSEQVRVYMCRLSAQLWV